MTDVFLVKCGRFVINAFLYYCWNGARIPCDGDICKIAEQEDRRIQCKLYCEKVADKLAQLTKEVLANKALETELATQEQKTLVYQVLFISLAILVLLALSGVLFWICRKIRRSRRKPESDNTAEPSPTIDPNPDQPAVPTAPFQTDDQSDASGFSQGDSAIETDVMLLLEPTGPCTSVVPPDCSIEREGKNELVPSPLSPVVDV
ncbi:uncharacterized protein LOC110443914 [Mizuhopecten yessoensis]|uniref:Uncharacterized protein n=1 Tax=Mizuhopecten yessoensis TaxID=6573 RepID=A0A210PDV2_MIZYE|nr:uncharacterized protein LOC110443914 [Mizuhopecten yessoensis]XP_021344050.1 uncharacterized protein LOC110443914 [Mizuhopecten yessoensis]OWF34679.1 hypothetical protein KP79_PYT11448 [Mizuhopecten yessoensis]